ncbi:MAG: hypothetical protein HOV79_26065, partial [Hamadaea sp.]|nr:hypothetical protein [Hamadaea sp.]
ARRRAPDGRTGDRNANGRTPHGRTPDGRASDGRASDGRTGASGLGLAIARQIVADHGGTIEVTSADGAGTTFSVRLPLL